MADFFAVIRRAVDGLSENTPDNRESVYEKARGAVRRQLENMSPRPSDDLMRRQFDNLEAAIAEAELEYDLELSVPEGDDLPHVPAEIEFDAVDLYDGDTPPVPEQRPGISFAVTERGKLSFAASGLASDGDLSEVSDLRKALYMSAGDLMLAAAGSNAFAHVSELASRYRELINPDIQNLSIDLLYAEGIRIENVRLRLKRDIESGDLPPMASQIGEALDSLIALHGPTIMSTGRGRDLVRRAQDYEFVPDREIHYKNIALLVVDALKLDGKVVEQKDASELERIVSELDGGPNPSRSADLAHAANNNLWAKVAEILASAIVGDALAKSVPGNVAIDGLQHLINSSYLFVMNHHALLRELAGVAGAELSWLGAFVSWIERYDLRQKARLPN